MTTVRAFAILSCAFFIGCASSSAPSGAPSGAATRSEICYSGSTLILEANGRAVGQAGTLMRRVVDPQKNTILEDVLSYDPRPDQAPQRSLVTITVDGNTFSVRDKEDAFKGTGEFQGESWQWTAWSSVVELPDGHKITSSDSISDGTILSEKKLYDPSGAHLMTFRDALKPTHASECANKFGDH